MSGRYSKWWNVLYEKQPHHSDHRKPALFCGRVQEISSSKGMLCIQGRADFRSILPGFCIASSYLAWKEWRENKWVLGRKWCAQPSPSYRQSCSSGELMSMASGCMGSGDWFVWCYILHPIHEETWGEPDHWQSTAIIHEMPCWRRGANKLKQLFGTIRFFSFWHSRQV